MPTVLLHTGVTRPKRLSAAEIETVLRAESRRDELRKRILHSLGVPTPKSR